MAWLFYRGVRYRNNVAIDQTSKQFLGHPWHPVDVDSDVCFRDTLAR